MVPTAKFIEYNLSSYPPLHLIITGLPSTNPLMQWHTPTNPASHYFYHLPRPAEKHNPRPGWANVTAIIPLPNLWEGVPGTSMFPLSDELTKGIPGDREKWQPYKHGHHGWQYLICLEGVEDEADESCLFPNHLRKELHGIRSVHDGGV